MNAASQKQNAKTADVYLCLGANMDGADRALEKAASAIAALPGLSICARSPIYRSQPQDFAEQAWFHNQVLRLAAEAIWTPKSLLAALLEIEKKLGRKRFEGQPRFGPRPIDIDMLLFGGETSNEAFCILPHPRMERRAFVLAPLRGIAPNLRVAGKSLDELLKRLDWRIDGHRIYQNF